MTVAGTDWTDVLKAGLYPIPIAARLIGAQQTKVRSWIEGVKNSDAPPIIERQLPRVGGKTVLGFLDLIESAFIRHFRTLGYSPQTLRKVAMKLRARHHIDHPFATNKRFKADGKSIFEEVVEDDGERRLVNLMNDNFVIGPVIEPSLFEQIFYVEDVARAWQPMPKKFPLVIVKPNVSFGRPVIKEAWIPTETLARSFFNEGGYKQAADEFGVTVSAVKQAVGFEQELDKRTVH